MPDSLARSNVPSTSRRTKIVLSVLALLVAIPAIALVILLNYDWNKARPWLNAKTSEAIGRPFAINGALSLQWKKPAAGMTGREASWRDHILWPHLIANDVHVSNPAGMPSRDMASVGQLSFSLNPFSLLHKTIAIPVLRFDTPALELLRNADGANNWSFRHQEKPSPWTLEMERVVFAKGVVHLVDAREKADVTADIDTIDADPLYGVSWKLHGTYNNAPVTGSGKAGAVLSLKQQTTPFPVQADFRAGATRVSAEGTITRPAQLAAIDLKLKLAGASMARLYNLTGILLPETPAFSTEGRLIGTLGKHSSHWTYDKFKGKVGSSDIGGRLEFQTGKPRGLLSGAVVSRLLNFSDLGPAIGADSNASKTARGVAPVQPQGKVLPVETFRTERWKTVDADVKYSAERIVRDKQLPISKLSTHLRMKAGVLTLDPLNFDMAGGSMVSDITLDGSGREGKDAIKASAKVTARHLKIKQLFPTIEQMQATVGEVNGDARLSATGNSIATLLAGANGEVKTLINEGSVSKLLLEEMGLNIGNIVLAKLFGDKPVKLNCMATDFVVTNGLMQTRTFVVDTDEAVITADGTVNLVSEQLNLTLRPQSKGLRIFSLRAPLHVRGPFNAPQVSVDKGVLAMKAGGAVALATLAAPIAALVPLIHTGPGENSECAKLLAAARVRPVAPPPATHAKR
jgi:uncharacterized protein involved in outer membrane biogenesis